MKSKISGGAEIDFVSPDEMRSILKANIHEQNNDLIHKLSNQMRYIRVTDQQTAKGNLGNADWFSILDAPSGYMYEVQMITCDFGAPGTYGGVSGSNVPNSMVLQPNSVAWSTNTTQIPARYANANGAIFVNGLSGVLNIKTSIAGTTMTVSVYGSSDGISPTGSALATSAAITTVTTTPIAYTNPGYPYIMIITSAVTGLFSVQAWITSNATLSPLPQANGIQVFAPGLRFQQGDLIGDVTWQGNAMTWQPGNKVVVLPSETLSVTNRNQSGLANTTIVTVVYTCLQVPIYHDAQLFGV